jgi:hypothetical protein
MRDDCHVFACDDFARLHYGPWIIRPTAMNLFAESLDTTPDGIAGYQIGLRATQPMTLPEEFMSLVAPYHEECSGVPAFDLNFLSKENPPFGLFAMIHGHIAPEGITNFQLRLRRKPSKEPPKKIVEQSLKLDGYPTGFLRFVAALGEPTATCDVILKGFVSQPRRWPLKISRRRNQRALSPLVIASEEIGFTHPKGAVEVSFFEGENSYSFEVSSELALSLTATCFDRACEMIWPILESIFKRHGLPQDKSA